MFGLDALLTPTQWAGSPFAELRFQLAGSSSLVQGLCLGAGLAQSHLPGRAQMIQALTWAPGSTSSTRVPAPPVLVPVPSLLQKAFVAQKL